MVHSGENDYALFGIMNLYGESPGCTTEHDLIKV
jgi:hypothetical protein